MDAIDRKLIEDAACAAGWTIDHWGEDNKGVPVAYRINERGGHSAFQPLYENGCCDCMGDALRLAVKCRIEIDHSHAQDQHRYVCASRRGCEMMYAPVSAVEEIEDDGQTLAATRRAIVRAAASIGQQKEGG